MIAGSIEELDENSQFVRLKNSFPKHDVYAKLEGLNTAAVSYTHLRAHET